MSEFPKALRILRARYFYKQIALAAACQCSVAHISWLERGKRRPSCEMLHKLVAALADAHVGQGEIENLLANAKADIMHEQFGDLT